MILYVFENILLAVSLIGCALLVFFMIDWITALIEEGLSEETEAQQAQSSSGKAAASAPIKKGKKHGVGNDRRNKHTGLHFGISQ